MHRNSRQPVSRLHSNSKKPAKQKHSNSRQPVGPMHMKSRLPARNTSAGAAMAAVKHGEQTRWPANQPQLDSWSITATDRATHRQPVKLMHSNSRQAGRQTGSLQHALVSCVRTQQASPWGQTGLSTAPVQDAVAASGQSPTDLVKPQSKCKCKCKGCYVRSEAWKQAS